MFLNLMLLRSFCNIVDLCVKAQGAMKEALLFNECFVESVVESETRRLREWLGRILVPWDVCCRQVCESVDKVRDNLPRAPLRFAIC